MRISDWSSDVCSSDLRTVERPAQRAQRVLAQQAGEGDLRINTVALAAPKIPAGARRHMRYFFAQYHFQNSHRFTVADTAQALDHARGDIQPACLQHPRYQ